MRSRLSMPRKAFLGTIERLILVRDGFYSPDPDCRRRAAALLAMDRGATLSDVARSANVSRDSVYRWLSNYLQQRDPAALRDNRSRHAGRPWHRRRDLAARAAAVLALADGGPRGGAGRLGLDAAARDVLVASARDATLPPRTRFRAALLFAIDRGLPNATIARAGGCDRHTVAKAPSRYLRRLLDASKEVCGA